MTAGPMASERLPWPALPWLTSGLSVAGIAVATYLTIVHYSTSAVLACPDTGLINCLKVTTSPQSLVLGIPVAAIGLAYFAVSLVLCLPGLWRKRSTVLAAGRLILASAGIGFVLYLVGTELLVLGVICLWCTAVHLIQLALFASVLAGTIVRWPFISSARATPTAQD